MKWAFILTLLNKCNNLYRQLNVQKWPGGALIQAFKHPYNVCCLTGHVFIQSGVRTSEDYVEKHQYPSGSPTVLHHKEYLVDTLDIDVLRIL